MTAREKRRHTMDRFYVQPNISKILGEHGEGEGSKLTGAQIHEIGVQAVESALGPPSDELRPCAERVVAGLPDNDRRLAEAA
jgi:hypothetical protein